MIRIGSIARAKLLCSSHSFLLSSSSSASCFSNTLRSFADQKAAPTAKSQAKLDKEKKATRVDTGAHGFKIGSKKKAKKVHDEELAPGVDADNDELTAKLLVKAVTPASKAKLSKDKDNRTPEQKAQDKALCNAYNGKRASCFYHNTQLGASRRRLRQLAFEALTPNQQYKLICSYPDRFPLIPRSISSMLGAEPFKLEQPALRLARMPDWLQKWRISLFDKHRKSLPRFTLHRALDIGSPRSTPVERIAFAFPKRSFKIDTEEAEAAEKAASEAASTEAEAKKGKEGKKSNEEKVAEKAAADNKATKEPKKNGKHKEKN